MLMINYKYLQLYKGIELNIQFHTQARVYKTFIFHNNIYSWSVVQITICKIHIDFFFF